MNEFVPKHQYAIPEQCKDCITICHEAQQVIEAREKQSRNDDPFLDLSLSHYRLAQSILDIKTSNSTCPDKTIFKGMLEVRE